MAVKNWGTGRKDYSEMVELSTVAIVRSHQTRYTAYFGYYVPAGVMYAFYAPWPSDILQFFKVSITGDENGLIGGGFANDYPFTSENIIARKLGYGKVEISIPKGYMFDLRGMRAPDYTGTYAGWPILFFGNYSDSMMILRFLVQFMGSTYRET